MSLRCQKRREYAAQTQNRQDFTGATICIILRSGNKTAEYFTANTEKMVYYPFQQETSEGLLELLTCKHYTENES